MDDRPSFSKNGFLYRENGALKKVMECLALYVAYCMQELSHRLEAS